MLLLGGFTLAAALSKQQLGKYLFTCLHDSCLAKRLAAYVLAKAGSKPHAVILANMFISTFASMWISNVAASVLCFSLIAPILRNLPHRSTYAKSLIMGLNLISIINHSKRYCACCECWWNGVTNSIPSKRDCTR